MNYKDLAPTSLDEAIILQNNIHKELMSCREILKRAEEHVRLADNNIKRMVKLEKMVSIIVQRMKKGISSS